MAGRPTDAFFYASGETFSLAGFFSSPSLHQRVIGRSQKEKWPFLSGRSSSYYMRRFASFYRTRLGGNGGLVRLLPVHDRGKEREGEWKAEVALGSRQD